MSARKPTTLALATLLGALLATSAMAQMGQGGEEGHGPMLGEMFAGIDTDSDGKITLEELEAHRTAMFTAADANGDGVLNAEELAAHHAAQMEATMAERSARMIERHDNNGDGSLSVDEMGAGPIEDRFAVIDTDNDGAISQEEAEAAADRFAEHRGQHKHDHKGGMGGGKGGWMGGWFN